MLAQQQTPPGWWRSIARPLAIAALIVIGVLILRRIPLTVAVVIVATLLAYALNPPIVALSAKMPRKAAVAIVFAALILILVAFGLIVIPSIVAQLQNLFSNSATHVITMQVWATHVRDWINGKLGVQIVPSQLQSVAAQFAGSIASVVFTGLGQLGMRVIFTMNTLVVFFTAMVFSYYLLTNYSAIKEAFVHAFPERHQPTALQFTQEVERVFGGYIGGQIILACFCAVFSFVGLVLAGAHYALLLGIITGFLYVIPYVGVASAIVLGALFGLLQSWEVAAWSVAVIFIVTRIADMVIVPKVMSKSVGISPMGVMLAVFAGGEMFGLWGLLLAIPTAALLKVVWLMWVQPWLAGQPQASK